MNKMGQPRVVQRASFLSFPLLIFVADQDDNTERKKITKNSSIEVFESLSFLF